MERESFEDEETARVLNEHFVPVKVDREERPDLDAVYMDAVQAMTGQGGWPMTVFLAPDGTPLYAGTYFPKEARHGLPAFTAVLHAVASAWRDQRERATAQGRRVVESIGRLAALGESTEPLSEELLRSAFQVMRQGFDPTWGGFGGAPKFPQPMTLEFLLRCHLRGYPQALEMATLTLDRMADGGIRDHLGGGFHRYSVDQRWLVPHFEKMLYDNAQLARVYLHGWQVTGTDRYREVGEETLDYLLREMRHPAGAFFSSQDADSEGEEGKFFVWPYGQLEHLAAEAAGDEGLGRAVAAYLGATRKGNWEGTNVLWTPVSLSQVAAKAGRPPDELLAAVGAAKRRLFGAREARAHPATDDKVLASWNGLAISAFAEAGRALGRRDYVDAAVGAADFVLTALRREDGRLLRAWREGRTAGPGYLDDHAMLGAACLTLYETTFDLRWFREARRLADQMLALFADRDGGGFFQTGSDAEALVIRPKELLDNAVPSGSSVAAELLQRLALLTGNEEYERAGVSALRLVRDHLTKGPTMFGHALCALDLYLATPREVAIVGDPEGEDTGRLVRELHGRFLPHSVLAVARAGDPEAPREVALLQDRSPLDGKATAYVCERFACRRPVTEPEELAAQLSA
jgi:uncharacterized protein YyaL (SSP411 family)